MDIAYYLDTKKKKNIHRDLFLKTFSLFKVPT